jgi:hypothetical protein
MKINVSDRVTVLVVLGIPMSILETSRMVTRLRSSHSKLTEPRASSNAEYANTSSPTTDTVMVKSLILALFDSTIGPDIADFSLPNEDRKPIH